MSGEAELPKELYQEIKSHFECGNRGHDKKAKDVTPGWKNDFEVMIATAIHSAIKESPHVCKFSSVQDKDAREFGHYIGMLKDLGDGRMASGIEAMRDNHKWLKLQRERGSKISATILFIVVSSFVSGALVALWAGLKHIVSKGN